MKKLTLFLISILLFTSCDKDEDTLPIVETPTVSLITAHSATVEGNVSYDDECIISYGFYWGTNANLEETGAKVNILDVGSFKFDLLDLMPNTTYYIKPFAINSLGTITTFGEQISFTTLDGLLGYARYIAVDLENNVWCGSSEGLSKFDGTDWTSYKFPDGLFEGYFYAFVLDSNGEKWLGTNGGLLHFDGINWMKYTTEDGLISNSIRSLYIDEEDVLYIGTATNGISKFDGSTFTNYRVYHDYDEEHPSGHIHTVSLDFEGNIWAGSCYSGLSMLDVNGNWTHRINSFSWTMISTCTPEGIMWFAGIPGNGIYSYSDETWTQYPELDLGVNTIEGDIDGRVWFGTSEGLFCYKDGIVNTYTTEDGLFSNYIRDIAFDLDGNIWVAADGEVSKINYEDIR